MTDRFHPRAADRLGHRRHHARRPFRSLSLGSGAATTLGTAAATSDRTVLVVSGQTVTLGGGQLNLGGNDLILHNVGSVTQSQSLTSLTAAAANRLQRRTRGTAPASPPPPPGPIARHLTALGMMPVTTAGTFDNQSVTTTDVVVKFTYYGDANLDGKVRRLRLHPDR